VLRSSWSDSAAVHILGEMAPAYALLASLPAGAVGPAGAVEGAEAAESVIAVSKVSLMDISAHCYCEEKCQDENTGKLPAGKEPLGDYVLGAR